MGQAKFTTPKRARSNLRSFGKPIAILEDELGSPLVAGSTAQVAVLRRSTGPKLHDEALLRGVGDRIPGRYWFDVVSAQPGARACWPIIIWK